MPIEVRFPDGSVREVPSERAEIINSKKDGPSTFIHRPLPSKEWRFVATARGWVAQRPLTRD